jgi:RimJ/RimL family protein N-acetyltransferase
MARPHTTLATKRLTLRPVSLADAERVSELAGDWEVASMTDRIPYPYTTADARHWIETIPDNEHVFAVCHTDQLIGACGVMVHDDGRGEIGYWFGKPWWGQGYATEAAERLIRYCFRRLKLSQIDCCHFVENAASKRVIEKLGFEKMGTRTAWSDARSRDSDAVCYALKRPRMAFLWRRAA